MLSSISRPTAMDMALSVRMLSVIPVARRQRKPRNTDRGMEMAMMREARKARRKRKTTATASSIPVITSRFR